MINKTLDPIATTALHFLDFGSVYSADGREHPLVGMTPVFQNSSVDDSSQPTSSYPTDPPSTALMLSTTTPADPSSGQSSGFSILPSLPPHFGARLAIAVIAIAILLIVIARLILK